MQYVCGVHLGLTQGDETRLAQKLLGQTTIDQDLNAHNDSRAHAVKRAYHNLSFVLSGAQLGITITTLATGYLAEPILAKFLNPLLHLTRLSETWTTPTTSKIGRASCRERV